MSETQEKLKALLRTKGVMTGADWQAKAEVKKERRAAGEFEVGRLVPGEVVGDDGDAFYLCRSVYPLSTVHGRTTLGAALDTVAKHISLSANDEELSEFDARSAVFVDTETTGLMGGTGTIAFLVGVGYFEKDSFVLDQCFMRDYDDEERMLNFLAERFSNAETVVSYNGKSFDLPLLRTRFITNRIPPRLDSLMHFDLVHAARRFWKKRLPNCTLGTIEEEILGIRRQGDVDSALIPQLWLEYLHTRDAQPLEGVFYHHKMDILSLVSLTAYLSQTIEVPDGEGFEHHEDRLSLVRLHYKQKNYAEVLDLAARLIKTLGNDVLRHECWEMMGFAAKRLEKWIDMEAAWQSLIDECPHTLVARMELAKHHEHRTRNLGEAERLCCEALDHARNRMETRVGAPSQAASFRHRLERIERKLGRAKPE